jgi:predicted RNA polymerase sigma factor
LPSVDDPLIGRIFRGESGRSVATLIRIFGDIDLAEDAVQEAFALALRKWPVEGLPPNPGGWITTTLAIEPSITSAASRADANSSGKWLSLRRRQERSPDPCRTTDSASSSPAAIRPSRPRRGSL